MLDSDLLFKLLHQFRDQPFESLLEFVVKYCSNDPCNVFITARLEKP
jgi:hypothetical protein